MERFSRELCLGEIGLGSLERRMNVFEMEGEGCSAKGAGYLNKLEYRKQ
jgi:hypothetical protein